MEVARKYWENAVWFQIIYEVGNLVEIMYEVGNLVEIIYEVENAGEIIYEVGILGRRLWANCLYLSLPTPSPESSLCHLLNLTEHSCQMSRNLCNVYMTQRGKSWNIRVFSMVFWGMLRPIMSPPTALAPWHPGTRYLLLQQI